MGFDRRIRTIIISAVILIVGIIHLGVGIGIVANYRKFHDVFQQQVGLSGFNIFVGLGTIIVGILGLVSVINQYSFLSRVTAIVAFLLGVIALASLITALALSGQTASYLHDTITNRMNSYVDDENSIDVIDKLQTTYQCCGVNLWLDWARIQLSVTNGINNGRRRRHLSPPVISPLTRALRQKRQAYTSSGYVYNLPSSYSVNLPLSCCKSGGTTNGNSLGGYCVFSANNGTSSFYVSGCMEPVANIAFSQITGIAVINTCLTILAFVYFAKLITVSHNIISSNDPNGINEDQQQQQYPYDPYYTDYNSSNPYHISSDSIYKIYL